LRKKHRRHYKIEGYIENPHWKEVLRQIRKQNHEKSEKCDNNGKETWTDTNGDVICECGFVIVMGSETKKLWNGKPIFGRS
jgi:hypothetical protein